MTERQPLADISIEAGHFYADTFARGEDALTRRMETVRILADAAVASWRADYAHAHKMPTRDAPIPRTSTSFMFDDYHNKPAKSQDTSPTTWLNLVIGAANKAGVGLDYIAREAAYVPAAEAGMSILADSDRVQTTSRGAWLTAQRPDQRSPMAMARPANRADASSTARSAYCDIELYSKEPGWNGKTIYACPYLASMWQLHRLEHSDGPVFPVAQTIEGTLPSWKHWDDVPPIIQLKHDAAPFSAQKTTSILPIGFLPVEAAVANIIQTAEQASGASIGYDRRVNYLFTQFAD